MKKLSILTLVFVITSAAHAGFVIVDSSGNSSMSVSSAGTVTLYIRYTASDMMGMDIDIGAASGEPSLSNGQVLYGTNTDVITPSPRGWQIEFVSVTGGTFPSNTNLASFDAAYNGSDQWVTGQDYYSIDTYWSALNADVAGFHFVPEPMTIALLGLGGLLLCRRKPDHE